MYRCIKVPSGAGKIAIPVNNEVIGVDLSSREPFWRYEHPQRHFPFYSSALSVDGTIVIGGRDRMVHAIDQASGEGRWTLQDAGADRLVARRRPPPTGDRIGRRAPAYARSGER